MPSRPVRRLLGVALIAVVAVAMAGPGSVFAHIDPDPPEAPAGSTQSVGFTVEHGCDGSPTVQLDMRLPDGVSAAAAEPVDGWTGSITDNVLTFAGGPLPDDAPMTFRVSMTLPAAPGATIFFPFVQRCEEGEIRWIDLPAGDVEAEQPAPAMVLTAPDAPTSTAATPATTAAAVAPPTPSSAPPTKPDSPTTVATTDPASATTTSSSPLVIAVSTAPPTANGATGSASESGSIVFFAVVAVVVGLGAFVMWRVRRVRATPQ